MRDSETLTVLEIEPGQCLGCAICVDVCPQAALAIGSSDLRPVWQADRCTRCADCVRECPADAITLSYEGATAVP